MWRVADTVGCMKNGIPHKKFSLTAPKFLLFLVKRVRGRS
jgi:hypothetical protein